MCPREALKVKGGVTLYLVDCLVFVPATPGSKDSTM